MKLRIGVGVGSGATSEAALSEVIGGLQGLGFDSIWLSEVLTAPGFDPLTALAWIAGRWPGVKLGTTMLLPGRNAVRLAKELATVDRLSAGKLLVTFVPGLSAGAEREAMGSPVASRQAVIEEALPVLRKLLSGSPVSHEGEIGTFEGVSLSPLPVQEPLEFWLGGMARSSLELCGRLGDGWLPARCTPQSAGAGRLVVEEAAARAGRAISPEHFGASIAYSRRPLEELDARALARRPRQPAPSEVIPVGLGALRERILAFAEAGFSKFVVRPLEPPRSWQDELAELADALLDLQS